MNRPYELGFIIPSNVPETETKTVIGVVQALIEQMGGKVNNVDFWGRRRLAYPIKDFREGYYVFLQMEFPPIQVNELERTLRLNDQILRHLVVRLDE
jgi:small subunit ribosomal protein S6